MTYCYEYPRPAVTVDAAVFRQSGKDWDVLLIKRGREPYLGNWALPGGFVGIDETVEEAVNRELFEETGLTGIRLEQLHVFSAVHRDPRHRTISIVFLGIVLDEIAAVVAGDDASEAGWFPLQVLPNLAFDHADILKMAFQKLV